MNGLCAIAMLLVPLNLAAQSTEREAAGLGEQIHTLGNVAASTRPSGPPIWDFTRDGKKVLVLGTLSYLPRNVKFDAAQIDHGIALSQALVSPPGLVVGDNISFFRGLMLWPGIRKSKFNPGGQTLSDVLPPPLYETWQQAEGTHLGGDSSVDRLRPIYAAFEVFKASAEQADLYPDPPAISLVNSTARRYGLDSVDARFRLSIADPKATVSGFAIPSADDIRCLEQTLNELEVFLAQAPGLGDAWATGDMERLESWAANDARMRFCWSSLTNQAIARQQGIADLNQEIDERWLAEIEKTLATHDTIFTTMSLHELLKADGLGSKLRRAGFEMVSPD